MSAVAPIPTVWPVESLGAMTVKIQDGTHFSPKPGGTDFKYITSRNIGPGRLRLESVETISQEEHQKIYRRCDVRFGDLLLTKDGANTGNAALSTFREEVSLLSSVAFIRANPRKAIEGYILQYLLSEPGKRQISEAMAGNAITRLTLAKIKALRVPLPPVSEQRTVASALADVDHLITVLERLITKKQAIKQGMMQRLLAYRPESNDRTSLDSVTSWLSGGTPDRSNSSYWSGSIPWISAITLKRLEVSTSDQFVTADAVRAGSKMAPLGSTLLLVRGSALHSEIRASLVTGAVCFNQDVKGLVPSQKVVPKFLTYSILANADKLLRLVTSAGNTAGVLDTKVVKSFEIWLPSRPEQERIVTVLNDILGEIDVLALRLLKARAIKQGMMQELLTGHTRLRLTEGAA